MSPHTDDHYVRVTVKGRGKGRTETTERVPWADINRTELIQLAQQERTSVRADAAAYRYAHRGQPRRVLKDLVRGTPPTEERTPNPVHRLREAIQLALIRHWAFIETQLRCSAVCPHCPDIKPFECYLDNEYLIPRAQRRLLDQGDTE